MKRGDTVSYHGPVLRLFGLKGTVIDCSRSLALVLFYGEAHPLNLPIGDVHVVSGVSDPCADVPILDMDAAEMETRVTAADPDVISEEVDYLAITRSFCR